MRLCRNSTDLGERWECEEEFHQCYQASINCTREGGVRLQYYFRGCGRVDQIGAE